jgi:putative pyrroloquinoline-quinone binding quinoprotein
VRLLRIDPAANRVVARIALRTPAGKRLAPIDLQVGRGTVWVVGQNAGALRIDPRRNVADRFVPLAGRTGERGIVTDGDGVWVLTGDGRLKQYDAPTGRAVGEVRLRAPAGSFLSWGPRGTLTLARIGADQIALVERASGRLVWQAALGAGLDRFLYDGEALWAHVSSPPGGRVEPDRLIRLDADSGRRLGQVDLPEPGVAGMAKVGRDIWVATPLGKIIIVGR